VLHGRKSIFCANNFLPAFIGTSSGTLRKMPDRGQIDATRSDRKSIWNHVIIQTARPTSTGGHQ
jgi:hypothetical protein